jgi:signal transduction histidine kinase
MLQAVVHDVKNKLAELALRIQSVDPQAAALAHAAADQLAQALLLENPAQLTPQIDAASPIELLTELAAEYGALFPDKTLVIAVEEAPTLWYYDVHLMRLALGNLVHNALQHCANRVVLTAHEKDRLLVFEVRDDGAGFLFEQPDQPVRGHYSLGTGLGVKLARQIAEAHVLNANGLRHGSLSMHNDGGAVVKVSIP